MIPATEFLNRLDIMVPDAKCELHYNHPYELLIATVLSAQSTDKRVNMVTKDLWNQYDLVGLSKANREDVEEIIKPVGTQRRKSVYIIQIAKQLLENYDGEVPNNRTFLESLPGVGHKVANVVLSEIFGEPTIAVDTHVTRVSKRLRLAKETDDVVKIEQKLMKKFPKEKWGKLHLQLVLFGRYHCKSKNPECSSCLFQDCCHYDKKNHK